MRILLVLIFAAGAAWAQQAGVRDGDRTLDRDALAAALTGQVLEFYDGSKARYGADGGYVYTYVDDGARHVGSYELGEDSRVCVRFDNGFARCDIIVRSRDRLMLITEAGLRFPVRSRAPL